MNFLTLDDLFKFCQENKLFHYSASENNGEPLIVQSPGICKALQNKTFAEDNSKYGLIPVQLESCHTNANLNGSTISYENMTNAIPSFANRPILGNIIEKDDGTLDFGAHDMEVYTDSDGNKKVKYLEKPIGVIPESNNAYLKESEDEDRAYLVVDGYIYEDYTEAYEILQRRNGSASVSVELAIFDFSYDAKKKLLNLNSFCFMGVTILGEEVKPGMAGANITLQDFSAENNSLINPMQGFIDVLEKLNNTLSEFKIQEKKGGESQVTKLEELCAKYNITADTLSFSTDDLSDEELKAKFAELYSKEETHEETQSSSEETASNYTVLKTLDSDSDRMKITYEISHSDIRFALYNLLSTFEEADNEWYYISDVYDGHFNYENWTGDKIYGQNYKLDGDNVSFDGERYNLHRELLTDTEYAELVNMRSNYAELVKFKSDIDNASKKAVLADEAYSVISDSEAFKKIEENMSDYSVEEIQEKCDSLLGKYAKSKISQTYTKSKLINPSETDSSNEARGPYGSLFKNYAK